MTPREAWEGAFTAPDRRPIYEWAASSVSLPPVLTKTGPFDVSGSRHFIAPLDALKNERVREVNVRAPVRSGKTLIADIAVPWAVVNDFASVLWVFQHEDIAKEHAELRLWPILESVPHIAALLSSNRHKTRTQEVIFNNGLPLFLCGPAIGNLQSRGFKWLICDEPWLYKPGILENAKARTGDFVKTGNSKILCISQAGEDGDDWDTQYNSGAKHEWVVPCLGCGKENEPKWSAFRPDGSRWGMRWDSEKDSSGRYNRDKAVASLRFECQHCGHQHQDTERTRAAWNAGGKYMSLEDAGARVSFHWTAIIDYPWSELLLQWLAAREAAHVGNLGPTIIFRQKRLAEPASEATVHEGQQNFSRIHSTTTDPMAKAWDGEAKRFFTVDRQEEDVYWGAIRAWSRDTGESRRLWFGKLFGESEIIAKAAEYGVSPNQVFLDSGFKPKGDGGVYAMCIRNGWIALKGADRPFFIHVDSKNRRPGQPPAKVQKFFSSVTFGQPGGAVRSRGAILIHFASSVCADRVQQLIDCGQWKEPAGAEDEMELEYRNQMAAEFKKAVKNKLTGRREFIWVCPSGNNHAFDTSKMQVAAAMICNLL